MGRLTKPLILFLLILSGCTPKNEPRYTHEGKKEWHPSQIPNDESVESASLNQVNLTTAYAQLKDPDSDTVKSILLPFSKFVLNAKFAATPAARTSHFTQMIGIFNQAFLKQLASGNSTMEFKKIKEDYLNTVFDGCARDMRQGCNTADLFARQPQHTQILTWLARDLDSEIDRHVKAAGSPRLCIGLRDTKDDPAYAGADECRNLVEERYRRLSMALYNRRSQYQDQLFELSYLKYARLFALLVEHGSASGDQTGMSYSYLAKTNANTFQTIIGHFQPQEPNSPEFIAFVNGFNPWEFSHKHADIFQYGSSLMFEFGTKCCLFEDSSRTRLSQSVRDAISHSQLSGDHFGPSFRQMVANVKAQYGDSIFKNLDVGDLVARIENPKSDFYNEYFFIVDRLFRGHLNSDEVERVLTNTNSSQSRLALPKMIVDYVKIQLIYMVAETNRFMAEIYKSDVGSNRVFNEATTRSRELTERWHSMQSRIDLLSKLMGGYFKGLNAASSSEFQTAYRTLEGVNRNIHYLSVYPNMIVMTYFLASMNGETTVDTWWGQIKIDASTKIKEFFDGVTKESWFRFGIDAEPLERTTLLYGLEYMLSTETLKPFTSKENEGPVSERKQFFDVIFNKYLDDSLSNLRLEIAKYEQTSEENSGLSAVKPLCDYEAGRTSISPSQGISFLDLDKYTYTGIGPAAANQTLTAFLAEIANPLKLLRTEIQKRRLFVQAMLDVITQDLLRSGKINAATDSHPDLETGRKLLTNLDAMEAELHRKFLAQHRSYFNCALTLLEVERYRTNRLYEDERQHLSQIFDLMKPLVGLTEGADLDNKAAELNRRIFTAQNGYRFDKVNGRTYMYSRFDLLARMEKRIQSDVFMQPTEREAKVYGPAYAGLRKPRTVSIYRPEGLERDAMVTSQESQPLYLRGTNEADRQDFIRQGMALLGGRADSYLKWQEGFSKDIGLFRYVEALEELYLSSADLPANDLADAYIKTYASFFLNDLDRQAAIEFGTNGRYPKSFFQDRLIDRDGETPRPFFYPLMNDIIKLADTSLSGDGLVHESLEYAKSFNSLQSFVFKPQPTVRSSMQTIYGEKVNAQLQRITDLFVYLKKLEDSASDSGSLNAGLKLPLYTESGATFYWNRNGKNLFDRQRAEDHKFLIKDFIQRSGNFYGTLEKVKSQ